LARLRRTLHGARPLGRPCPTDCRTESSVQTWLSPVVNSAASQPIYAKLIGSRQSPRLLPLYSPPVRQGPFPPPALPGFIGTTSPSAICLGRLRPSRASRCGRPAVRSAPLQTSLVAHKSSCARVVTTTPAEQSGAYPARLPDHSGLPQTLWRVGFRGDLFGACTVFTSVTTRTLRFPPYRGYFSECFRPFVASWPAPSASGRSERGRVGISPTGLVHLRQGTHNAMMESFFSSLEAEVLDRNRFKTREEARRVIFSWMAGR
jgi:hypothetical protein